MTHESDMERLNRDCDNQLRCARSSAILMVLVWAIIGLIYYAGKKLGGGL